MQCCMLWVLYLSGVICPASCGCCLSTCCCMKATADIQSSLHLLHVYMFFLSTYRLHSHGALFCPCISREGGCPQARVSATIASSRRQRHLHQNEGTYMFCSVTACSKPIQKCFRERHWKRWKPLSVNPWYDAQLSRPALVMSLCPLCTGTARTVLPQCNIHCHRFNGV